MASPSTALRCRRGWLAVGSLTLALAGLVSQQVRPAIAHADLTPAAAAGATSPSVAAQAATDPSPAALTNPTPDAPAATAAPPPSSPSPTTLGRPAKGTKPAKPAKTAPHAAPAGAVCSGPGWQQKRGEQVLATLRDTGQRSGVTVSFKGAKAG